MVKATFGGMGRVARVVVPGLAHHVTQRGNDRQDVFFSDDDRRTYLRMLKFNAEKYGLDIDAYCLMTNHVHLIVIPAESVALAQAIGRTHWMYSLYVNEHYERTGHLWQNRYYSCPMDPDHRVAGIAYAECNPTRAGMVVVPWQYQWSSAAAHCGAVDPSGLLNLDRWRAEWDPEEWRQVLSGSCHERVMHAIREQTLSGRPLGAERFVADLEARFGRCLRPARVRRPKSVPGTNGEGRT